MAHYTKSLFIYLFSLLVVQVATLGTIENDCEKPDVEGRELRPVSGIAHPINVSEGFHVFCYLGNRPNSAWNLVKSFLRIWTSIRVGLESGQEGGSMCHLEGASAGEVCEKYANRTTFQGGLCDLWWWLSADSYSIPLSPFKTTCIGIQSMAKSQIRVKETKFDTRYVILFIFGLLLFLYADPLSRNVFFHYNAGVFIGLLASLLILVFVLSKFVPSKRISWGVLLFGWPSSLGFLYWVFSNLMGLASLGNAAYYILTYLAAAALFSFLVVYRWGPVTEPRTLDIIRWGIQAVGLLCLYSGLQLAEVAAGLAALLVAHRALGPHLAHLLGRLTWRLNLKWLVWFPPQPRLLTPDEYEQQMNETTRQELAKLKEFCHSPKCDAWQTMSRLQSPKRFANFVSGRSPHLEDSEIRLHLNHSQNYGRGAGDADNLEWDGDDD